MELDEHKKIISEYMKSLAVLSHKSIKEKDPDHYKKMAIARWKKEEEKKTAPLAVLE